MPGWVVATVSTAIKAVALGVLGGLLIVGSAYAHAAYLRSEPGADAIVAAPPRRVDIWFTQELFRRQGENRIRVIGPGGAEVQVGETQIDDDDRKHIWVNLPEDLDAGSYQVEWRNLSVEDGHDSDGSFSFTLDPQAAVTSTPMGEEPPTETATQAPLASPSVAPETNTPLPASTAEATRVAVEPSPTASAPSGGGCALGAAPFAAMIGFVVVRRSRRGK
jgi:methionine-rich copper-binding protein CopC